MSLGPPSPPGTTPRRRPSFVAAAARVRSPLSNTFFERRASYGSPLPSTSLPTYDSPLLLQYDFPFDPAQLGIGGQEARRIFIGPRVESTPSKGREGRAGSVASRAEAIADNTDGRSFQDYDEDANRSKRLHRTMRQVSWMEEAVPSKVGLKAWRGGSFEIGGDLRESARRKKAATIAPTRQRAQTTGGSAFAAGKRPDFVNRPRADTTTSFQSAVSHQEISFEDSRGRGEYFRPAAPPPAVEAEHPQLLHSLLRKSSDLNSSTVSLILPAKPSPSHLLTPEVYTPRKPKPTLRSASESYPEHLRPRFPPSPAKSILRSASESYPNNSRPLGLYQPPPPSKLGQPEVRREPSTHFGDEPAAPVREVLARTDEHLGMLTEEPDEIPAFPVVAPKPSDVIRQERMLLRAEWTVREDLPDSYDENSARKFPTQRASWEEVAVIWKKGGTLEIYTEFTFPVVALFTGSKKLRHVVPLNSRTQLSIYSSPDLIFCLTNRPSSLHDKSMLDNFGATNPEERKARKGGYIHYRSNGTNIFILRPRTLAIAKEWTYFLWLELGGRFPPSLDISVPGVGAKIRIPLPTSADDDTVITANDTALVISKKVGAAKSNPLAGHSVLKPELVVRACTDQLRYVADWTHLLNDADKLGVKMQLAWRRGQVLDWVQGGDEWSVMAGHAIRQPLLETVLELRPALHYPTIVRFPASGKEPAIALHEPPAVEGYLYRKNQKGRSERIYLSSHRGHLFLSSPSKAFPPDPPVPLMVAIDNPTALVLAPFTLGAVLPGAKDQRRQGSWSRFFGGKRSASTAGLEESLLEDGETVVQKFEREERRRAEQQIMAAQGYINMREIMGVSVANEGSEDSSFEISLKGGLSVRFECYSNPVAAEWIGRLGALIKYWARRNRLDALDRVQLQPPNSPSQLPHTSDGRKQASLEAKCPDLDQSSSPLLSNLYNQCVVEGCHQPISRSSRFFVKEGLRDMFRDRYCLLVGTHIIEYDVKSRNWNGEALDTTVYHTRKHTLSLRDCYVYSGQLALSVVGANSSGADWNPADYKQQHFPRVYDDGSMSSDTVEDCTFVIWKKLRSSQGLGSQSSVRVYRTRNKLEMHDWLYAVDAAIQRLYKGEREAERQSRLKSFPWLT